MTAPDVVAFLKARLDEDEAWANESGDRTTHTPESRAHVLADIAAKRALIDIAASVGSLIDSEWGCCHGSADILAGRYIDDGDPLPTDCDGTKELVRILGPLAAVYAWHEDHREEWKP